MVFKRYIIVFVLSFGAFKATAQLCQGSLGDPIVNITFGSGANPGAPLIAASTSYQYVQSDCPNDGFYSVRNSTIGCYSRTWHTLTTDHTGNPGGYFMLVNASFQAGAFYVDTVRGLCGSTTYEFASWILNVLVPSSCSGNTIQPNITFSIEKTDGTLLQSYNSGNIAPTTAAQWRQYGFFFTTPATGSDIVLRIVNNAPGGCGNDLLLDDITFRPCGPQITSTINGSSAIEVSICEGQTGSFVLNNSVSGGFILPMYQWQLYNPSSNMWTDIPAANAVNHTVNITNTTVAGLLRYRLAVAEAGNLSTVQCRVYSKPFSIQVNALPLTSVKNTGPVCAGQAVVLTAMGGRQYAWSGPDGFTGNVSPLTLVNVTTVSAGKYYVNVSNTEGCIKRDSTTVVVNPAPLATTSFDSVDICEGESVVLSATGGSNYQWTPAASLQDANTSDPVASPVMSTLYKVVVSNQLGCKDTAYSKVIVIPDPVADAGPDKLVFAGQSVQLTATASGSSSFSWTPGSFITDPLSIRPMVNPPVDIKYVFEVVSACGTDSDTVEVKVYKDLYIPNAFTPNGDGINDTWNIPAIGAYPVFEVKVYGRWGELLYLSRNSMQPWDGKYKGIDLPMGAYFYLINLHGERSLKGAIMLIR